MNYFSELQIKGFKCFANEKIPFRKLTILAGINSVGKSSVIQSLLLTRSVIDEQKKNSGGNVERIKLNDNYLLSLGKNSDVLTEGYQDDLIEFIFSFTNKKVHYQFHSSINTKDIFLKLNSCPKISDLSNLTLIQKFYYLHAERIGPRKIYDLFVLDYPHAGWRGEMSAQMLLEEERLPDINQIKSFQNFYKNESNGNLKFRDQVIKWMSFIFPGINISSKKLEEINNVLLSYNNRTPYNVGFGISYTLPIIINGLLASEGSILIVENPEAHLHPSGQSRLGQFLSVIAASGVQVIVETHSEHIVNGARVAAMNQKISQSDIIINFFSRNSNEELNIQKIEITPKGDLNEFPRGFFDQVQIDMAEIIRKKREAMQ